MRWKGRGYHGEHGLYLMRDRADAAGAIGEPERGGGILGRYVEEVGILYISLKTF